MKQEKFKKQIKIFQNYLQQCPKEQYANGLQQLKELYFEQASYLITQLNDSSEEERESILKQLKEADKLYLEVQNLNINGHVLFTRHGQCSSWGQKRYGISPNTPISKAAEKNLATTNQSTGALLLNAETPPPIIAISPMNRAMQTAGLLIPKKIKNAEICVNIALVENSYTPSGFDIRSKADMQKIFAETSFLKHPVKKILFMVSRLFYSDKDLQKHNEKRQQAVEMINQHGPIINTTTDKDGRPDVPQNLDYKGNKIDDTKKFIEQAGERDCWLIGHGKNFKSFFAKELGVTSSFTYGETRSVYKIQDENDKPSLFSPPYSLVVNQKTGKIEGKYTGTIGTPEKKQVSEAAKESVDEAAKSQSSKIILEKLNSNTAKSKSEKNAEKEITPIAEPKQSTKHAAAPEKPKEIEETKDISSLNMH